MHRLCLIALICLASAPCAASPVWTQPKPSLNSVEAALESTRARAEKAPSATEPILRQRVELLTQLQDLLRQAASTARVESPPSTDDVPKRPPANPSWVGWEANEAEAEEARAEEARWTARHNAIIALIDQRNEQRRTLRAERDALDARPAVDESDPQKATLLKENHQLEETLIDTRLAQLDERTSPTTLARVDRMLEAARERRRRYADYQRAYREALGARLKRDLEALKAATPPNPGRVRIAQAEFDRLTVERALDNQRQQLRRERSELDVTRRALNSDAESERTASRLKRTLQRLQKRRQELMTSDPRAELAAVEAAQARRFDVDDALLGDTEAGVADATSDTLLRDERAALSTLITRGESLRNVIDERARLYAELDQLVRTRLFGIRDAPPIWSQLRASGEDNFNRVKTWFARIGGDDSIASLQRMATSPLDLILLICALLVLPIGRIFTRRLVTPWMARDVSSWRQHLRSAGVGFVLATMPAASLWLTAILVQRSGLPEVIGSVLSAALSHAAVSLWAWMLVRRFLASGGVVQRALETESPALLELSKVLSRFIIGYAFCLLPARLLERDAIGAFAFARLAWIAYGVLVFLIVLRVTRPENPLLRGLGDSPRAQRVAGTVRWGLRVLIVAIVGMEVFGYQYGARWLARRLALSALVVVPLSMIYLAFASRLRARSAAAARTLLAVCLLGGGVGVALIWGVDEGAIRLLGAITIFGEGKTAISLLDLGGGLFALTVTLLVLRFMPRLFKHTLFRAVTLDEGIQYAVVTMARYVTFFIGVVAIFSALNVNFEKLGWLVAALGVGLGFGLQEIVSNFVSGIIILVERPVKVGDFVSIGALDGRVLHINIRSTTLLSLDRREFIVPNKDLITKDVTNWTRTDRVIRITVPIGVAYGSDVAHVTELLDAAANSIPGVMQTPPPEVLFMAHGDSSLDFEVRVHVPDPQQRFKVLNAVNSAINATLAEHEIVIPFPQRDVHLFYENAQIAAEPGAAPAPAKPARVAEPGATPDDA